MNSSPDKDAARRAGAETCLARSVADTLAEEPALEAVTIDSAHRKISVATLGRADVEKLTQRLTEKFESVQKTDAGYACTLLSGKSECAVCELPFSEAERKKFTIQHDDAGTTIARVTCPTAPKFWRWRDMPFPKIVPRDVEFLEHVEEIDEWKPQLALAVLCGVFGLAGFFSPVPFKLFAFAAAYLAGGFYPAEEVWERLRKRTIDVHFLMLFVAAGAAYIGAWVEGATLLFLFSLSGALEHFALGRTQKEIRSLFRDAPKTATVINEQGRERELPVETLRRSDWIRRRRCRPRQFPHPLEIASRA